MPAVAPAGLGSQLLARGLLLAGTYLRMVCAWIESLGIKPSAWYRIPVDLVGWYWCCVLASPR